MNEFIYPSENVICYKFRDGHNAWVWANTMLGNQFTKVIGEQTFGNDTGTWTWEYTFVVKNVTSFRFLFSNRVRRNVVQIIVSMMNIVKANSELYPWRVDFNGFYKPTSKFKEWCKTTFNSTGKRYKTRWYYEDSHFIYFRKKEDVFLSWMIWG